MLFINKLFNSIACLLSFTNLQLVIPGRTWILLYLGRTVYKRLWACLALYGGLGEPCASFREIKAITSKLTVFTLYYLIISFWGIFGQKLGWGRHLQSGSRLIQMSLAITSSVV